MHAFKRWLKRWTVHEIWFIKEGVAKILYLHDPDYCPNLSSKLQKGQYLESRIMFGNTLIHIEILAPQSTILFGTKCSIKILNPDFR